MNFGKTKKQDGGKRWLLVVLPHVFCISWVMDRGLVPALDVVGSIMYDLA